MLSDRKLTAERWQKRVVARLALAQAFGEFIVGLAVWDWFVTITFRNEVHSPERAVADISGWLAGLGKMAGPDFAYVIAEEFGDLGGRFHSHLLVSGVSALRRDFWWREAFRRFGRSRIEPCEKARAASFYTAKYAAKQLGDLHFGGLFQGSAPRWAGDHFALKAEPTKEIVQRGHEVALSESLPRDFYRLTHVRR